MKAARVRQAPPRVRIFEPHAHMYARTTNDYEAMARAGIEVIVEPAFWLGETRRHAGSFLDYFSHLTNYENARAAKYGIKQFVTLAMNPKESNDRALADAVIAELPRFLEHERVVAVGEIGFDRISPEEEDSMVRQIEMARRVGLPLLIHSPHVDKPRGIRKNLDILKRLGFPMERTLMDHNTEETTDARGGRVGGPHGLPDHEALAGADGEHHRRPRVGPDDGEQRRGLGAFGPAHGAAHDRGVAVARRAREADPPARVG